MSAASLFLDDRGPAHAPGGTADGEAYLPTVVGARRDVPVPKCEPQPPFLLAFHAERWSVQGGRLRPDLTRIKLVDGLGGVQIAKGEVRASHMRGNFEERGWQILPPDVLPPSQARRGSYLYRLAARKDVTLPYWVRAYAGSTAVRADAGLLYEFLDHLVDAGIVPAPTIHVIERELDAAAARLRAAEDKAQSAPSWRPRVELYRHEVEVLHAARAECLEREVAEAEGAAEIPELIEDSPPPPAARGRKGGA